MLLWERRGAPALITMRICFKFGQLHHLPDHWWPDKFKSEQVWDISEKENKRWSWTKSLWNNLWNNSHVAVGETRLPRDIYEPEIINVCTSRLFRIGFSLPAGLMLSLHWLITWTFVKGNTGIQAMLHLWQFRGSTKPYIFIIQKNVPSLRITLVWWWRRWIPPLAGINIGAGNPPYQLAWDTYQALDIYILSNFKLFLICGVRTYAQSSIPTCMRHIQSLDIYSLSNFQFFLIYGVRTYTQSSILTCMRHIPSLGYLHSL